MENILVVGVNARAVACSLKKLEYNVYSADYFGDLDLQKCTDQYRSVLSQQPYISCGHFIEKFNPYDIKDLAKDFISECEGIICLTGVSPEIFPKNKIIGNKSVENVDDKYYLYKKLKNQFNFPLTFQVSDIDEAGEISRNYPGKNFIVKPIMGAGGYGIRDLSLTEDHIDFSNLILQEKLNGKNISASVLSTKKESKTILKSQQIIGDTMLGQKEPFGYCGNITPLDEDNLEVDKTGYGVISEIAEDIITSSSLIGSNGVDFVINNNELYVVEVNPRIQGTLECAELVLNINMVEAHMEASQGNLMDVPSPDGYAVKMIIHARNRSRVGQLNFEDVFDLPAFNVIIEEAEPVVTVIKSGKVLDDVLFSAHETVGKVYNNLNAV
ncbi:MAG: ATP-grasp domain-containing protein [Methanobacterium sp.]|nr:ATP-grasp domain-containing protein [Methanobacterium sp.]